MTFLDFARTKPPEETYDYCSNGNCPYAQYLKTTGICANPSVTPGGWRDRSDASRTRHEFDERIDDALNPTNNDRPEKFWTWGQLVARLERLEHA